MSSILHTTTTQNPSEPTRADYEHTPVVKKISDHEIMVDISHFHHPQTKDHYITSMCLYSLKRLVDEVHFKEGENVYKVIFDLSKINKKDEESCKFHRDEEDYWIPRNWKIDDVYHAVINCNIHGNWSDVSDESI